MLLLVRHGETAPNVEGRLLGRMDPPLTARGEEQARVLAAGLPRPDLVVASPLQRARATAEAFGVAVRTDERWTELDYGEFDGRQLADVPDETWARLAAGSLVRPGGRGVALGTRRSCAGSMRRARPDGG